MQPYMQPSAKLSKQRYMKHVETVHVALANAVDDVNYEAAITVIICTLKPWVQATTVCDVSLIPPTVRPCTKQRKLEKVR